MKIYNIKDKQEYIREVITLTQKEWGHYTSEEEFNKKLEEKIIKIKNNFSNHNFCKLILVDKNNLIGFISIFPHDCDEKPEFTPWYATMYVKKEYRCNGYSRILNDAILKEAKKRGFKKIYLKSELNNYYEKFGAIYLENLNNNEKLFYFQIS